MHHKSKTVLPLTQFGTIPKDWEFRAIKDVSRINEQSITKDFKHSKIEYIDISSVDNGVIKELQVLDLTDAPSRARRIVNNQDTIISTVRPNLKHFAFVNGAKPNTIVSTGFAVITPININPRFLYYYLTTENYTKFLTAIADAHTSAYPSFNPDIIKNSLIPYPREQEQQAIAKILSDFDSKIQINQLMNRTLEFVSETVFRHWFVDFEFPNSEGKPYKSSDGKMVYNDELEKEIPEAWQVKTLGEVANNFDSKRVPVSKREREKIKGIYPYYGAVGIVDYVNNYLFDGTYLLMSEDGVYVVDERGFPTLQLVWGKFWVNNHAHVLQGKLISTELLYLMLKNTNVKHIVTGAVQPKINQSNMNTLKLLIPDDSSKQKIENFSKSIYSKIRSNQKQNQFLSKIHDLLLPKLMSGKVRVPFSDGDLEV